MRIRGPDLMIPLSLALSLTAVVDAHAQRGRFGQVEVEPNIQYDGRFTFVRLRYPEVRSAGWSYDYPAMERHFMKVVKEITTVGPVVDGSNIHNLDDPELHTRWLVELAGMRDRINSVRQRLAAAHPRLAFIGQQFGMFSMLPLSKEQVLKLRADHAIYMADSGRFNVVGMSDEQIDRFIAAVVGALDA